MNSIVFTHVYTPEGVTSQEVALDRLGAWSDAELCSLDRLIRLIGCEESAADIAALHALHLAPNADAGDVAHLLENAAGALERLLERVLAIEVSGITVGDAPPDFDAWVRWSGARLQDTFITVRRALEV